MDRHARNYWEGRRRFHNDRFSIIATKVVEKILNKQNFRVESSQWEDKLPNFKLQFRKWIQKFHHIHNFRARRTKLSHLFCVSFDNLEFSSSCEVKPINIRLLAGNPLHILRGFVN